MKVRTKKLSKYMKKRSEVENVEWGLSVMYLEQLFVMGMRDFFGVTLDNKGNLLSDEQEPYENYFNEYKTNN